MDFISPPAVIDGFRRIVEHGTFGYIWCFDGFYDAVIAFQYKRHQVEVEKSQTTLTYGTVSTLHYTIQAYYKPGDSVVMNMPIHDPFAMAAQHQGVQVLTNPLRVKENRYQLNFNLIEEQLKTYRPTLWFFCPPYNPPGRIWREEETRQVSNLCQRYGTTLTIDEAHVGHTLDSEFISRLTSGCAAQNSLIAPTSPNKTLELDGLKASHSIILNDSLR